MIDGIYKQIQKEIKAKYVMKCRECGYTWFYAKKSKYITDVQNNSKPKVKCFCKGRLDVFTMEEWLKINKIDIKEITRYM